ncbi:energy-coupling factor transporter transmembrane component T [Clostridium ganghwense]|uniref:Energy-coupling factor transporter transmembrane component T n=1 Tax=Clostridium ganghwense TaxID=312089 RepID=A0ABT4CS33_9CLOT|nr:energy-coupling factor transporter transmembrane component T [Clostridium ganghwense]MCY6370891.1 energy-coupling factor transporter transmembrane component T [Clostridium ganghwense]
MSADWLFKKEEYIPEKDHQQFLDKSIISILKVLSKIRRRGVYSNKFIYRVNPTLKVFFTLLNIILISISRSYIYVLLIDTCVLGTALTLDNEERRNILTISVVIPLFTLIMLIPSLMGGNIKNSILILIKVIGTIVSVNLLSYTTKWDHVTKALKLLFIPDLFIWVMEITIKYIVLLGEYSVELLYALKLRSVGKNNKKYKSISKIMGNLFLKSKEMGEEMFSAMECRGFTGEYTAPLNSKIRKNDVLYFIINLSFIIIFILTTI